MKKINHKHIQIISEFAQRNFNFDLVINNQALDDESAYWNYIIEQLSIRIEYLIKHNMDLLMQALYRIDVDDKVSDEAFDLAIPSKIARFLAQAILNRQLQKLEYMQNFDEDI